MQHWHVLILVLVHYISVPKRAVSLSALRDIFCKHTGKNVSSCPQLLVLVNWCNARQEEDSLYSEFLSRSLGRDEPSTRASTPALGNRHGFSLWPHLMLPSFPCARRTLSSRNMVCFSDVLALYWVKMWNEIHFFLWHTLKVVFWGGVKLILSVFSPLEKNLVCTTLILMKYLLLMKTRSEILWFWYLSEFQALCPYSHVSRSVQVYLTPLSADGSITKCIQLLSTGPDSKWSEFLLVCIYLVSLEKHAFHFILLLCCVLS